MGIIPMLENSKMGLNSLYPDLIYWLERSTVTEVSGDRLLSINQPSGLLEAGFWLNLPHADGSHA